MTVLNSETLKFIISHSPYFFYSASYDSEFTITFLSANASECIGFNPDEIVYKPGFWLSQLHPEDAEPFLRKISNLHIDSSFITDYRFKSKDGEYLWLRDTIKKITDPNSGKEMLLGSVSDITDRKEDEMKIDRYIEEIQLSQKAIEEHAGELNLLNAKLSESETALKELNASKDRFFSIIAHDLRSPISALLGYSDFIVEDYDTLEADEVKEFSENINTVAKSLTELLNNLLDWSRIQVGTMKFEPENLKPVSVVNSVLRLLKANAKKKNIDIINNIDPGLEIYSDENMLHTILRNLISNAIKFTGNNGKIEINQSVREFYVEISVSDNGVGMDQDTLDKLFRIDVSVTTTGTDNEKGTGLGLILCKELAEKNGGSIYVDSWKGKGSTFKFTVPIASK